MARWPSRPDSFPRLYAILDVDAAAARGHAPLAVLEAWLDAGVRLIQLRAKRLAFGALLELTDRAVTAVRAAGGTLIVNDRVDVARMAAADGVHLGQDDLAPADARSMLGEAAVIGFSTHDQAQVAAALAAPISYLAIGPVFPTSTKDRPDSVVGLEGVSLARGRLGGADRPLVAIGGITVQTAGSVIAAGADGVAVIADLLVGDPGARARAFLQALEAR